MLSFDQEVKHCAATWALEFAILLIVICYIAIS